VNVHLERKEALTLLKDLIQLNITVPSIVALKENNLGKFELMLKDHCDNEILKKFVAGKSLALKEVNERDIVTIYKP